MSSKEEMNLIGLFGLSYEQSQTLFSIQRYLVQYDIKVEKNEKIRSLKREWLLKWEEGISDYFNEIDNKKVFNFENENEIICYIKKEIKNINKTWFYLILLESIAFVPYTPLINNENISSEKDFEEFSKEIIGTFDKCKYNNDNGDKLLKDLFITNEFISKEKFDSLKKTYKDSLDKISGKSSKLFFAILITLAFAAIGGLLAAIFLPSIVVALFGAKFASLHGIALVNACLALLGGGAVATGGLGMAGGYAVIVGGGAVLGLTVGGATNGIKTLIAASPEFALSQSAKLETILKEIILNEQQDIVLAQKIIEQYKVQILELNNTIKDYELEGKKNKEELKNIKKTIKYMQNAYKEMSINVQKK